MWCSASAGYYGYAQFLEGFRSEHKALNGLWAQFIGGWSKTSADIGGQDNDRLR
jgi:hypothetical protein